LHDKQAFGAQRLAFYVLFLGFTLFFASILTLFEQHIAKFYNFETFCTAICYASKIKDMVQVHQEANRFIVTIPKETDFTEQWFIQLKFQLLAEKWKEESRFLSFAKERTELLTYQAIIDMGKPIIPYILMEMQAHPNHWFAALKQLTGTNPILPEYKGNMKAMINDWILWGKKNQII
jgi:hypothetical protein